VGNRLQAIHLQGEVTMECMVSIKDFHHHQGDNNHNMEIILKGMFRISTGNNNSCSLVKKDNLAETKILLSDLMVVNNKILVENLEMLFKNKVSFSNKIQSDTNSNLIKDKLSSKRRMRDFCK